MINKELARLQEKLGVCIPEILLPTKDTDLSKWAIIACDQYTSEPEYWKKVEELTKEYPSTLNMIFPEVYLEDGNENERIQSINRTMHEYLEKVVLKAQEPGFIYIDRSTSKVKSRKGIMMALDLEKYDYAKGSQSLIRATEGTVLERIPPRVRIRRNAELELPHIMILIDDPSHTVIEPVAEAIEASGDSCKLYDFELMMGGGHIKGYKIQDEKMLLRILEALDKLASREVFNQKYSVENDKGLLLFAVGDGNHSLATAKACWNLLKETLPESELKNHPARYALVEVVNIHDTGLEFEPIHRVVFNIDKNDFINEAKTYYSSNGMSPSIIECSSEAEMLLKARELKSKASTHVIKCIDENSFFILAVDNPIYNIEVGTFQCFLDEYAKKHEEIKIDYIHGDDVVKKIGSRKGNMGFFLPVPAKEDLFKTVILEGVLPRKTFSMGEAEEKRYYMECRKIK